MTNCPDCSRFPRTVVDSIHTARRDETRQCKLGISLIWPYILRLAGPALGLAIVNSLFYYYSIVSVQRRSSQLGASMLHWQCCTVQCTEHTAAAFGQLINSVSKNDTRLACKNTCNGPFPGLPGSAGTKTNLDFTEARDSEWQWQWHQLRCIYATHITTPVPRHSVFLQAGCPSCRPTNSVKALKAHWHARTST